MDTILESNTSVVVFGAERVDNWKVIILFQFVITKIKFII